MLLEVFHLGEKLKCLMRHSWMSDGRRESVAEHSWRASFMALLLVDYLDQPVDIGKLLAMVIVHDLVEAICGDVPAFDLLSEDRRALKEREERAAICKIASMVPVKSGEKIRALWEEFESAVTYEAKVAMAIDKLEAQIQHNEADLSTWTEIEKEMVFRLGRYTNFDSFMDNFRKLIEKEGAEKIAPNKDHLSNSP
ncbi:HD domain-containing protein [Dyella jejuensis]|uniref:HD domain-containing protein n=2 Tax=Dyella jejuensis TaxID=1432009 RepID=A0ABW8JES6_9GAMM